MDKLPISWAPAKVAEITNYVQRGKSPQYAEKSQLPVINQKCIRWHGIDEQHLKFIHSEQIPAWSEERYIQRGDILWNSTGTGTIGRAALYQGISKTEFRKKQGVYSQNKSLKITKALML